MAHVEADLAVKGAALLEVNRYQLLILPLRNGNFAGVQPVVRIEGLLDFPELRVEVSEVLGAVLAPEPAPVLSPHQAAVFLGELDHAVRDAPESLLLLGIGHVECRPDMQHAAVDMAEHAVLKVVGVKKRAELQDVVSKMLRRNGGILSEGDRLGVSLCLAEEPYGLLSHGVD